MCDYLGQFSYLALVKNDEISFKDLTKSQLDDLKDLYIDSRVESMTVNDLREFVREVLELQVRGTVGNQEEREIWKEMKVHFDQDFEAKLKEISKSKGSDRSMSPEEEEFQKRLQLIEQRKQEESQNNEDMW